MRDTWIIKFTLKWILLELSSNFFFFTTSFHDFSQERISYMKIKDYLSWKLTYHLFLQMVFRNQMVLKRYDLLRTCVSEIWPDYNTFLYVSIES